MWNGKAYLKALAQVVAQIISEKKIWNEISYNF